MRRSATPHWTATIWTRVFQMRKFELFNSRLGRFVKNLGMSDAVTTGGVGTEAGAAAIAIGALALWFVLPDISMFAD